MRKAKWESAEPAWGRLSDPKGLEAKGQRQGSSKWRDWRGERPWTGGLESQGVWRVRSRSLNFTLGPRKLLTKVSGELEGWVHTGSAGAGNQGDRG